ncbi:ROK family protein [bacterium]|nr:ROK family protein [bacterium]
MTRLWGAIEAGGTKFNCALVSARQRIVASDSVPTTDPVETLEAVIRFFRQRLGSSILEGIGIASFGPLNLDPFSDSYGLLTSTPKKGWSGVNPVRQLKTCFDVPIIIDTDVIGAALAEYHLGAARGLTDFCYITVGTGIGAGFMINDQPVHGLGHSEWGHIRIPHDLDADPFPGNCPFHGDCLEGLASGSALEARWGSPAQTLAPDHPAWDLEAHYLALALSNIIMTLAPQRIILGGGIMKQTRLFAAIRAQITQFLAGYMHIPSLEADENSYIVPPGCGQNAGILGAALLVQSRTGQGHD